MVEYDRSQSLKDIGKPGPRICIVGVGGAGSNVVDRITLDRIVDATLVCMHTDVRVLGHSMAPVKVQLGVEIMKGIGAGGDPDLGREAALFAREQIRQAVEGHDIVFISAGLGGGTGSGAAPVIAEIAKNTGALVLVVATMPFSFEGRRRLIQAEEALELLQKRADALVLFENNRMGELVLPKDGIQKAFSQADQIIAQSLRAVATITSAPSLVKLGLDDLTAALSAANGRCLFGFGEARGQNRGAEALKKALKSPLIDQGRLLHQTQTLLVHIAGGESLTLVEVESVMKQLGRHVPDQTHILFGLGVDAKLEDAITITLVSSLGLQQLNSDAAEFKREEPAQDTITAPAPFAALDDLLRQVEVPVVPLEVEVPIDLLAEREEQETLEQPVLTHEEPALEEPFTPSVAFAPEPAHISVYAPVVKEIDDAAPSKGSTLAAVVARGITLQTESVQDDLLSFDTTPPIARKPASDSQQTLSLGGGDRGRFKDTEPSIVQGEDLDVPTWMRLKKKLRR